MGFDVHDLSGRGSEHDGLRKGMDGAHHDLVCRLPLASMLTRSRLPYIFRFRQCLSEVLTGNTPTPKRSLMNAAKYATAFPVIIFSAMQTVVGDPFDLVDPALDETRWIGRDTLFRLWYVRATLS